MRNLYEQCLKLTQFAAMEFEEIFQFSQERLKQALETELIENGYAVQKQSGFLYAQGTVLSCWLRIWTPSIAPNRKQSAIPQTARS